jgi:hypothetical protein
LRTGYFPSPLRGGNPDVLVPATSATHPYLDCYEQKARACVKKRRHVSALERLRFFTLRRVASILLGMFFARTGSVGGIL